ncbi:Hypothetical_protein [Hexamita inflata]|uniref:Hypothetical_protein n=1 Tax=Hexamita inflata TaxID=28002 RepID=A0AA86RD93_9EUKA|nr:Hypothetical protein HINF_LOCUS63080 [Hexamita inflata]
MITVQPTDTIISALIGQDERREKYDYVQPGIVISSCLLYLIGDKFLLLANYISQQITIIQIIKENRGLIVNLTNNSYLVFLRRVSAYNYVQLSTYTNNKRKIKDNPYMVQLISFGILNAAFVLIGQLYNILDYNQNLFKYSPKANPIQQ